jgi:hypothetical protein
MSTFTIIVFLSKLLIPQKLWIHSLGTSVLGSPLFLDPVGMSLMGVIMGACVF